MAKDPVGPAVANGRKPRTERVPAPSSARRLAPLAALVVLLLVVAELKPWGGGGGADRLEQAAPGTAGTSATTRNDDSAERLAAPICLGAGAWRVASLETWRSQRVRVWRAIEPVGEAHGPLDPAIPGVPVVAVSVEGLGYCAPAYGADTPTGPAEVVAWSVGGDRASALGLQQILPDQGTTPITGLFLPRPDCAQAPACPALASGATLQPWKPGRVVFRYTDLGSGRVSWFAVDIELIPASPTPGPSPDASAG